MLKKQFYKHISKNITYIKNKHTIFFRIYIKIADVLEITLVMVLTSYFLERNKILRINL